MGSFSYPRKSNAPSRKDNCGRSFFFLWQLRHSFTKMARIFPHSLCCYDTNKIGTIAQIVSLREVRPLHEFMKQNQKTAERVSRIQCRPAAAFLKINGMHQEAFLLIPDTDAATVVPVLPMSAITTPRIHVLIKNKMTLADQRPGTKLELPKNSSWYPCCSHSA